MKLDKQKFFKYLEIERKHNKVFNKASDYLTSDFLFELMGFPPLEVYLDSINL
jgi:hypothetical protein